MSHPLWIKEKAVKLRKSGYSLKEISNNLKISKSTASLWLQDVILNEEALERLKRQRIFGHYKAQLTRRGRKKKLLEAYTKQAAELVSSIKLNKNLGKLLCSLLYWCEGNKTKDTAVKFTNSDPMMIATFLGLFRKSFALNEQKFRALVHLHEYHNKEKQVRFWSKITKIPLNRFYRSYLKPNTKKRSRRKYPGCITVSYYDVSVARELFALYTMFTKYLGA